MHSVEKQECFFFNSRKKGKSGLIVMGDLPRWKNDLIVIGDIPKQKNMENGLIVMGDLPKWKKERVRAQRRTRNEVGLENALPKRW